MKSADHLWDLFFSPISPIRSSSGSSDSRIPGYDPSQVTGWTLFTADARGPRGHPGDPPSTSIGDHRPSTGLWLGHMVKGYIYEFYGRISTGKIMENHLPSLKKINEFHATFAFCEASIKKCGFTIQNDDQWRCNMI